jgi:ribosomal protein S18 acetylase RimI-like enzyme
LWVGRFGSDPERWWVWDVRVDEPFRGRGLGRRATLLAEELARTNGAVSIGLNVFADNTVARNLYGSLGYRESSVHMRKQLGVDDA